MELNNKYLDSFSGVEFDWFAADINGNIGVFSTAGYGEIPTDVLQYASAHQTIFNQISLPNFGSEQVWQDFSRLGLFVFDWQHWEGPYLKVASPQFVMVSDFRKKIIQIPDLPKMELLFSEIDRIKVN